MRPIYRALGRIAGAAIASGDGIVRVIDQSDPVEIGLTIDSDGQWIDILAEPHDEVFRASASHRLSAFDNYPIDRYIPEDEGFDAARAVLKDRDFPQQSLQTLVFTPEGMDEQHFDGIHIQSQLYPLDDDFRVKEYVEVRNNLRHFTPGIFFDTLRELGYDIDDSDFGASQSEVERNQSEDSPAFQ